MCRLMYFIHIQQAQECTLQLQQCNSILSKVTSDTAQPYVDGAAAGGAESESITASIHDRLVH